MLDGIRSNAQSFVVKLAFGLIIVVFVFWGISAYTGPSHQVAQVNGKNITMVEFQRGYESLVNNLRYAYPELDQEMLRSMGLEYQVLQMLVEQKMFELESDRSGIDISPYDMRRELEMSGAFNGADGKFSPDVYLSTIKQWNQTPAQFEQGLRRDMLSGKFQSLISAGAWSSPKTARDFFNFQNETRGVSYLFFPAEQFAAQAVPTEEELSAAYETRQAMYTQPAKVRLEYVKLDPAQLGDPSTISDDAVAQAYESRRDQYSTPAQVKARHILIMVDENAPEDQVKKAEESILAVEKRILAGEDFADVARESGQDGTAAQGGDLGWFSHAQMVPAFADAAFALEAGQMSGPVRSRFGFHLIKVEDKKDAETKSLDEVKDELRAALAAQNARDGLQGSIDSVLGAALSGKSMAEAAALVKLEPVSTELMLSSELGGLGIKSADVDTVMNSATGQVLGSALMTDSGALVIKVQESVPQRVQALDEVREDLSFWVTREKSRKLAKEEAEKVRQSFDGSTPPADLQAEVKKSELFSREGYIPELGLSMDLVKTMFELPAADAGQGLWLKEAYIVDEGAVLVSLAEVRLPDDERWQAEGGEIESVLLREKANIIFYAFKQELGKKLDVRILNDSVFQK